MRTDPCSSCNCTPFAFPWALFAFAPHCCTCTVSSICKTTTMSSQSCCLCVGQHYSAIRNNPVSSAHQSQKHPQLMCKQSRLCTAVHVSACPKSIPVHTRVFCSLLQMGTLNFWLPAKGAQRASCPWSTLTPTCATHPCVMLRVPMMSSFLTWPCLNLFWHSSRSASVPFVSVPAWSTSPGSHPGDRAVGGGEKGLVFQCALCSLFGFRSCGHPECLVMAAPCFLACAPLCADSASSCIDNSNLSEALCVACWCSQPLLMAQTALQAARLQATPGCLPDHLLHMRAVFLVVCLKSSRVSLQIDVDQLKADMFPMGGCRKAK